jgi:hypothetical protein
MRKQGFISHIHEESVVAQYVKNWFGGIFLGQLELFVSSIDATPGNWLEQVRRSLQRSYYVLPLLSQRSATRPWINFESGSAFIADHVELIPLLHKDLSHSNLEYPYSSFQAYDLRIPDNVLALVQFFARDLELTTPSVDAAALASEIRRLDKELYQFHRSLDELKQIDAVREALADVDDLIELPIREIEIWDELELRARIYDEKVVEASGYTRDSMGFNVYDIPLPESARYLVLGIEQSENSVSHDTDKFIKLAIDRQIVITDLDGHAHYDDSQFTVKGDGLFMFEIPYSARHERKISLLNIAFWRIELQNALIRLYAA